MGEIKPDQMTGVGEIMLEDGVSIIPASAGYSKPELSTFERRDRALNLILALHRAPDGCVSFSFRDKDSGEWAESHSIQVSHLKMMFPEFIDEILGQDDPRFTVHSMFRPGFGRSRIKLSDHALKNLPVPYRKKYGGYIAAAMRDSDLVKYLTAAFADLDYYKLNLTPAAVLGTIKQMQDDGLIPPVSLILFSGQGAWPFWLLKDKNNPYSPPRVGPGSWQYSKLYRAIQRKIVEGMETIGADIRAAINLAVQARIPGGNHRETNQKTEFWIPMPEIGKPNMYTLEELADFFKVRLDEITPVERKMLSAAPRTGKSGGKNGFAHVYKSQFRQFNSLMELRGKFPKGTRNCSAYILAYLLCHTGCTKQDAYPILEDFGRNKCDPPLGPKEITAALGEGYKVRFDPKIRRGGVISNRRLSEMLAITKSEAVFLETWKAAGGENVIRVHPNKIAGEALRLEIAGIVAELREGGSFRPSAAAVAGVLRDRGIAEVSVKNVTKHINHLRYGAKSAKSARKKSQRRLKF